MNNDLIERNSDGQQFILATTVDALSLRSSASNSLTGLNNLTGRL